MNNFTENYILDEKENNKVNLAPRPPKVLAFK